MKKITTLLAGLVAFVLFASCVNPAKPNGNDNSGNGTSGNNTDPLFEQNSDGLLLVTNNSDQDLVLFYDTVKSDTMMGAINGNATRHKMKLPESGKLYVIHAVKYSDYKNAKTNAAIANLKVVDSALVYSDATGETSCDIGNSKYHGNCEIRFNNQTDWYVQVGNGSASDEDIFHTMKPNSIESVFVDYDNKGYVLYMILNQPIRKNGKITGIQRRFIEDWSDLYMPSEDRVTPVTINPIEVAKVKPIYKEAYIVVTNNSSSGYYLDNGSERLASTLQQYAIGSGLEAIFQLEAALDGRKYSQLKLTNPVSASRSINIPEATLKNGYVYSLEITADGTAEIVELGEIDPDSDEIKPLVS